MNKLTASGALCVGLTLLAVQAEAQHKTHSGVVHSQPEYVRLAEVCAFGFWCDAGILNSNNPAPPRPLVTPKAKLTRGIDRSQFRLEIASHPELVVKMTHMVFGEVGRHAPLPVKIIQLETAFNRAQARGQTLALVLLSVKESPSDGYYAIDTYCAAAEPSQEEVETFEKTVLTAVLRGSNLSDVGYGPMTGNASADLAAHQFAKGDPGYQLQAGDAYFREGPFINDFPEISPSTLLGLGLSSNNATNFGSFSAPYCKPGSAPIRRYCSVTDPRKSPRWPTHSLQIESRVNVPQAAASPSFVQSGRLH
jgi:hypothetical protein